MNIKYGNNKVNNKIITKNKDALSEITQILNDLIIVDSKEIYDCKQKDESLIDLSVFNNKFISYTPNLNIHVPDHYNNFDLNNIKDDIEIDTDFNSDFNTDDMEIDSYD